MVANYLKELSLSVFLSGSAMAAMFYIAHLTGLDTDFWMPSIFFWSGMIFQAWKPKS